MSFLRKLWEDASNVNENEPNIAELIAAFADDLDWRRGAGGNSSPDRGAGRGLRAW